jgi:hypothetical protein
LSSVFSNAADNQHQDDALWHHACFYGHASAKIEDQEIVNTASEAPSARSGAIRGMSAFESRPALSGALHSRPDTLNLG